MRVHIADTCRSSKWRPFDVEWDRFVEDKLQIPVVTSETYSVYKSLDKDEKTIYKDCGGYVFGSLKKNSRAKQDVESRNALLLDLDYAPLDVWEEIKSKMVCEMVLHSTHSHESKNPRFRLVVPLNRDCTPDEYECVARAFAAYINMDYFDKTTFQRNRLMYFPSRSQDGEWVFEWNRGEFLNVDNVLSTFSDWRDMTTWFYHKDERTNFESNGKKRQNPTEVGGIIGAFNKTYGMDVTIETFLPEVYKHEFGDRYTFLHGSSAMGAVTYDNIWLYSYHATDPAQGRLLNALELVACHLFDDDIKKAVEFASNLPEIRKAVVLDSFEDISGDVNIEVDSVAQDWYGQLEIEKSGKLAQTDRNVRIIFENDKNLVDVFKYNDFVNNIYLVKNVCWKDCSREDGDVIRNEDYPRLRTYFGLKYGLQNRSMIDEHMQTIAYENRVHPIREYLSSLVWDGVKRIDTAMMDYFGADDNLYVREVFRKTLIGAIMRAFNAGAKHDTVLLLVGLEGTCKSEFFKRLGGEWYSDSFRISQQGNRDFEQLQGKWIIEIAEFDKLSRVEVGEVKNYITKSADVFRPAFGHVVEDFPRQCIFVATTNEDTPLKSETGNRRFDPVHVRNGMLERGLWKSSKYVFKDMDKYEVDQMWAEAMKCVLCGENNILSVEATHIIDGTREDYEEQSVLSGEIDDKLTTLVPENYEELSIIEVVQWWSYPDLRSKGVKHIDYITGVQVWIELLGRTRESYGKLQQLEVLSAMRKSKLIDTNETERLYTHRYGRQRCYKIKYNQ
jgi:hypothetical protein